MGHNNIINIMLVCVSYIDNIRKSVLYSVLRVLCLLINNNKFQVKIIVVDKCLTNSLNYDLYLISIIYTRV